MPPTQTYPPRSYSNRKHVHNKMPITIATINSVLGVAGCQTFECFSSLLGTDIFFFKMEVFTNLDTCTYCYILGLVHLFTMHYIYIGSPMVCSWICLLSNEFVLAIPKPWRGDRKHITSWIKSYPTTNHGRFFLSHVTTQFLPLQNFYVASLMQKFLASFQQYCFIIHCDVIAVVSEKFIP